MVLDDGKTFEVSGYVKFFDTERGFGFLLPENGGKEVFLHASLFKKYEVELPQQYDWMKVLVVPIEDERLRAVRLLAIET